MKIFQVFRRRSNIIGLCFGLAAGFIIRDENDTPNLQLVDELIMEYESKELLLQKQREDVEGKIARLTKKKGVQKQAQKMDLSKKTDGGQ